MDSTIQNATKTIENASNIHQTAKRLANLVHQSDEFQELIRLGNLVHLDPDVNKILQQIRYQQSHYGKDAEDVSIDTLEAQLLELPSYQAYLKAENNARDLFKNVDKVIGEAAGISFAENAKQQGCGCGG